LAQFKTWVPSYIYSSNCLKSLPIELARRSATDCGEYRQAVSNASEKALERFATSDKTTIVFERQPDGKMRVASGSWDGDKIIFKDQVVEVRHAIADARLKVARKNKAPDDWDPPYESYDPYGQAGVASDEFIDD
jgi:hypothetical protein